MFIASLLLYFLLVCGDKVANSQSIDQLIGQALRRSSRQQQQHRPRSEGRVRLVGGQTLFEGNVEIHHLGQWGSICDDEWDISDASVVCRQLGFILGAVVATTDSRYGKARKLIWMDNLFCAGNETVIQNCQFEGWKSHDCDENEAAGVICRTRLEQQPPPPIEPRRMQRKKKPSLPAVLSVTKKFKDRFGNNVTVRLAGGHVGHQGRVEILADGQWYMLCGNGWSIDEAQVVCRQLNFGFAERVLHHKVANGNGANHSKLIAGLKCVGDEPHISDCLLHSSSSQCFDSYNNVASVACVPDLPDLAIDFLELQRSAFLEDRSIMFLQCAMEENCLSQSAYQIDKTNPEWIYETRRLLRFTASIKNVGRIDFRPFIHKSQWAWHSCHRHYHSMEVFAHFDILDSRGRRVAEGHKASFCLEDNVCDSEHQNKFACADYGDQGISVGCADIYKWDLDCQWIDITDIGPGNYRLKITINPEFKVAELSFNNNAAYCDFLYTPIAGYVDNCTLAHP